MKIAMVTGHEPKELNQLMKYGDFNDISFMEYIETMGYIIDKHLRAGYQLFMSNISAGVNLDFAEMVKQLWYINYTNVQVEIVLPSKKQKIEMSLDDKQRYEEIVKGADIITYVEHKQNFDFVQKDNKYMVNKANKIIVFWNGEKIGTIWNTIQYAKKQKKELEIIDLRNL